MILFYIRHGDPIYTPDQLTPLGHRQAESVAKRLSLYDIDRVYSSTSTRAMETAAPTCEILKKELITLDWMHEKYAHAEMAIPFSENKKKWIWHHPDYADLFTSREMRELGDKWYEHPAIAKFDLGRASKRIGAELDKWLASLGYEHDREKGLYKVTTENTDKRIALFAHEGAGKVFFSEILDIPYPYVAAHMENKHTGMSVIAFESVNEEGYVRAKLLTLSNDSHLYRDGLPTRHVSTGVNVKY